MRWLIDLFSAGVVGRVLGSSVKSDCEWGNAQGINFSAGLPSILEVGP